ncbi:MAG: DUF3048 domain-containing protein, partial [Candidatus Parcubacteria bacterium]|nr:DUF3048 domain-containing protein [Candidatus Parcubacteria bacterium]
KYIILIIILLVFILAGCTLIKFYGNPTLEQQVIFRDQNKENIIRRKIDGLPALAESEANLYPVAIMVENAADSWPQSGLDKANLVIEAITEASIPRFVAIYANDDEIKKIGPVRSTRPYFLDWINIFQPLYMHVGGSPEALSDIKNDDYKVFNFDQFFNGDYYWRDKWRYAPHNVYTSSDLIKNALEAKNLQTPADFEMWKYKKDLEVDKRPAQVNDIEINYALQFYKIKWQYNKDENNYIRYQNGEIHKMSDGEWIKAKNVIVQVNEMEVLDSMGRKRITTTGEGKAWIFRDGETIEGKWVKDSKNVREKYYDSNGNEIEFNGGTTWIEVIPDEEYIRY